MLFPLYFLPCQSYFYELLRLESDIYLYSNQQYLKQSYHTRAHILGPHKIETLIVPVLKHKNNALISEIEISYAENWIIRNLKTIENCYRKSPFFEHYYPYIQKVFQDKPNLLLDLNSNLLSVCLRLLKSEQTIWHQNDSYFEVKNNFISFNSKKREEIHQFYMPKMYFQNFGKSFEPNLSIIDLLFNQGFNSRDIIKEWEKVF